LTSAIFNLEEKKSRPLARAGKKWKAKPTSRVVNPFYEGAADDAPAKPTTRHLAGSDQGPRQRAGGKAKEKKQWTVKTKASQVTAAYNDLRSATAGARDAAVALHQQRQDESEDQSGREDKAERKRKEHLESQRRQVDYAADIVGKIEGKYLSFKEPAPLKYDGTLMWFFVILTCLEWVVLFFELLGGTAWSLLLHKKVLKLILGVFGAIATKYFCYGWQFVTTITVISTVSSMSVSVVFADHTLFAIILPLAFWLVYLGVLFVLALRGIRVAPFSFEYKHSYHIDKIYNTVEDASVRADAQSLTECKHEIPLYAATQYRRLVRLTGLANLRFRKMFAWKKTGKKVTLNVSLELLMQTMVPRCTGVELSIEQVGNAISNMVKAVHSVAIDRSAAACMGVFEHTKLLAFAAVRSTHQKVAKVPFPRASPTNAQ
jgi:hypothetical protein